MIYLKTYEELKYTQEHKKLINQLRYKLNRYFGVNCCGVSKVRYAKTQKINSYNYNTPFSTEYVTYTGSTMLFNIYIPWQETTHDNKLIPGFKMKIENLQKITDKIGLHREEYDNSYDNVTEEQMKELISRLKYIDVEVDADKYNI